MKVQFYNELYAGVHIFLFCLPGGGEGENVMIY